MFACVGGKGEKGAVGHGNGTKNRGVDSEHGASKVEVCFFVQRADILSKWVIFFTFINATHAICTVFKKFSVCN